MKFIDEVIITVKSGDGGPGAASFRREKYIPFGGPDGGDGGRGGHIYITADEGLNTLVHYRGKKNYSAQDGQSGSGQQKSGKSGEDLFLKVPVGTLVKNAETDEVIVDLTTPNQPFLLAKGGIGGLGNINFKSATNQTPRYAQTGLAGIELTIKLELKLLADLGLVGLPNAGKSTLISVLSAARPKVADYPFTTLEPQLGVVTFNEHSFVLADVPGLIEKAHEGKGLGIKFLKHLERTKALVHLVDCSWCLEPFEAFESYMTIREELTQYNLKMADKREIICLTKIDALSDEAIEQFQQFFEEQLDKKVLPISAVSGKNIDQLKMLMWKAIK